VVAADGLALTDEPVIDDNPDEGAHPYVAAVPDAVKDTAVPGLQNPAVVGVTDIVGDVVTVTVVDTQAVELIQPSYLAKYEVVDDGADIVNGEPVPIGVPPQLPEYQYNNAPLPAEPPKADNVIVDGAEAEQKPVTLAAADTGSTEGVVEIVIVAEPEFTHPFDDVAVAVYVMVDAIAVAFTGLPVVEPR
jgi:hypothetical protein